VVSSENGFRGGELGDEITEVSRKNPKRVGKKREGLGKELKHGFGKTNRGDCGRGREPDVGCQGSVLWCFTCGLTRKRLKKRLIEEMSAAPRSCGEGQGFWKKCKEKKKKN